MASTNTRLGQGKQRTRSKCHDIRNVDLVDKGGQFIQHGTESGDLVDIRILGKSPNHDALVMGGPAPEDHPHVFGLDLHLQGVQIVFHRSYDHLWVINAELIRLVARSQGKRISPPNQADHLLLHLIEFRILAGIVCDGHDIDVVQGAQVVEMKQVVVDVLGTHDQISEKRSPPGNLGTESGVQGTGRSQLVNAEADTAETACHITGVPWIFSQQEGFESPGHGAAAPGVFDLSLFDLHLDLEVSLDSCHRINGNSLSHGSRPPLLHVLLSGEEASSLLGQNPLRGEPRRIEGTVFIIETGLRTSLTGGSGIDAEIDPVVPPPDGTVRIRLWAFATLQEEAPVLLVGIVPAHQKPILLKMGVAPTVVMNRHAEIHQRPTQPVEGRRLVGHQEIDNGSHYVVHVNRTCGEVDNRVVRKDSAQGNSHGWS